MKLPPAGSTSSPNKGGRPFYNKVVSKAAVGTSTTSTTYSPAVLSVNDEGDLSFSFTTCFLAKALISSSNRRTKSRVSIAKGLA